MLGVGIWHDWLTVVFQDLNRSSSRSSSVFNPMGIKSSSRVLLDARIYRKMFRRSWPSGLLNVLLPHISELVGMEVKAGARGLTF